MQQAKDSNSKSSKAAPKPGMPVAQIAPIAQIAPTFDQARLTAIPPANVLDMAAAPSCANLSPLAEPSALAEAGSSSRSLSAAGNPSSTAFQLPMRESAHSFAALIHDARNLVTSIDLYGELLAIPGVLAGPFHHYAGELGQVAAATHRLLESLSTLESRGSWQTGSQAEPILPLPGLHPILAGPQPSSTSPAPERAHASAAPRSPATPFKTIAAGTADTGFPQPYPAAGARWRPFRTSPPIHNLAEELLGMHNLLAALAGPAVTLGLSLYGGRRPVGITGDDLTRILVNLVKNAAEAQPLGGHIQIVLEEFVDQLELSVADTGTGIPPADLERIFSPGYSSHVPLGLGSVPASVSSMAEVGAQPIASPSAWPSPHSGLGLTIVRSIVGAAGGSIFASNRSNHPVTQITLPNDSAAPDGLAQTSGCGAIFRIILPITS